MDRHRRQHDTSDTQTYFNKELGKKIIYKTPLFITEVKFRDTTSINGGANNTTETSENRETTTEINENSNTTTTPLYNSIVPESKPLTYELLTKYEAMRLRFIYALNELYDDAILMERQIFRDKDFNFVSLKQYACKKESITNIDNMILTTRSKYVPNKEIKYHFEYLSAAELTRAAKEFYQSAESDMYYIIKGHDSELDVDNFLPLWFNFLHNLTSNDKLLKKIFHTRSTVINVMKSVGFKYITSDHPIYSLEINPLFCYYAVFTK